MSLTAISVVSDVLPPAMADLASAEARFERQDRRPPAKPLDRRNHSEIRQFRSSFPSCNPSILQFCNTMSSPR
jgi:hypothetical protein